MKWTMKLLAGFSFLSSVSISNLIYADSWMEYGSGMCQAVNPGQGKYLKFKEYYVENEHSSKSIWVTCPIPRDVQEQGRRQNIVVSMIVYSPGAADDGIVKCVLRAFEDEEFSSESRSIIIEDGVGVSLWEYGNVDMVLPSFSCKLPPGTAVVNYDIASQNL